MTYEEEYFKYTNEQKLKIQQLDMEKTTFTLEGTQTEINPDCIYMVDFSKMTSVNNLVTILASMAIAFPGNHPNIEALKPFLNLDNPIQKQQPPVEKSIELPKLKSFK